MCSALVKTRQSQRTLAGSPPPIRINTNEYIVAKEPLGYALILIDPEKKTVIIDEEAAKRIGDDLTKYLESHGIAHLILGRTKHGYYEKRLYEILSKIYEGDAHEAEKRLAEALYGASPEKVHWVTIERVGGTYRVYFPRELFGDVMGIIRDYLGHLSGYSTRFAEQGILEFYTPELLLIFLDLLKKMTRVALLPEVEARAHKALLEELEPRKARLARLREVVASMDNAGPAMWSPETPRDLLDLGRKLYLVTRLMRIYAREAARNIYGRPLPSLIDIVVVDPEKKEMYYLSRREDGSYTVKQVPLREDDWILSQLRYAMAFTMPGKPIYIRRDLLEDFVEKKMTDGVHTLVHEAMHKAGGLGGPTKIPKPRRRLSDNTSYELLGLTHLGHIIGNILWNEGANELVTWRQLIRVIGDPRAVGEYVARNSPYKWEAVVVAAVARALGYPDVWSFIRDKSMNRISDEQVEKAIENKLMRYLSRKYDEIPENYRKLYPVLSTKRKWLRKIREEIYSRSSIASSLEYVPPFAYEYVFEYAKPVLENSFPREFVEEIQPR